MNPRKFRITAVTAALCVGFVGSFLLGRYSSGNLRWIRTSAGSTGSENSGSSASFGDSDDASAATRQVGPTDAKEKRPLWSRLVADLYSEAEPGKPTPGFADLFKEAINRGEPYSQGCLQMLIEGMRREDLPQALEFMKRIGAEGQFRGAGGTGNQSIVWQAFWNRFGEIDPLTALA
jgi:hypothetical protein